MDSERGFSGMTRSGFPHSDICASTPACGSAQLIAANHVLLRLLTPRHPPSALSSLTTNRSGPLPGTPAGSRPRFAFREMFLGSYSTNRNEDTISRFVLLFDCHPEWRIRDSNPRPQACKARALPTELIPRRRVEEIGLSKLTAK